MDVDVSVIVLLGQPVRDHVLHELGVVPQVHLLKDVGPIGAHGLDAQRQLPGDLADGLARADQAQHLELAVGEQFVRRAVGALPEREGEVLGDPVADVLASPATTFLILVNPDAL